MSSTIAAAGEVVADGGLAVGIALGQDAVDARAAEGAADEGVVGEGGVAGIVAVEKVFAKGGSVFVGARAAEGAGDAGGAGGGGEGSGG